MKAARVYRFGPPEVITIEEMATPSPGDDEIVVRVAACGVGPWDAWVRAGKSAIEQPLPLTLGADLSGTVTQLGSRARGVSLGQSVFGVTNARFTGAYADFAVASAAMVAPKPEGLDHRAAAGLPVVAATARQMVDDEAHVVPGERVLVHGAGGSVGALAVQLAMARGATVVGTATPRSMDYVRSLGVEHVVDATAEDFTRDIAPVHSVIDTVGGATQRNRSGSLVAQHHQGIGHPRIAPELREQGRRLAAVMRLVIEDVCQRDPQGMRLLGTRHRPIGERALERTVGEARNVRFERAVCLGALPSQLVEIRVELVGQAPHRGRLACAKPGHPRPIGQEQVVESAVDRPEKSPHRSLALLVGQCRGERIELVVHPPVVASHRFVVPEQTHDDHR
jgi:D-arabinose 1-dehydrogenase-like Zn-dependent alcohol dehydrogenase